MSNDQGLSASVRGLLEDLFHPSSLVFGPDEAGLIEMNDGVYVRDGSRLYEVLTDSFDAMPWLDQKALLDALYLVLRRSIYDVARLRSVERIRTELSAVSILLDLLDKHTDVLIAKRLIRLLGVVSQATITIKELHRFLERLKTPGPLSLALLQAFKTMLRQEDTSLRHSSFFSLMGAGAGLYSSIGSVFFNKELQVSMWFRVEAFPSELDPAPHLLWCSNEDSQCLDVLLLGRTLCLFVDVNGAPNLQRIEALQLKTSESL